MASIIDNLGKIGSFIGEQIGDPIRSILGMTTNWDVEKQKELMDYQKSIEMEMAEYNSPKNQMKRLLDAGINPDMAFAGSVQNTANGGSSIPSIGSHPSQVPALLSAVTNAFQQGEQLTTQRIVADSEAKKNESEANLNNTEADEISHRRPYRDQLDDANIQKAWNENLLIGQQYSTEYQIGLGVALDNWSKGYNPLKNNQHIDGIFDESKFEDVFDQIMQEPYNIIKDIQGQYELDTYDLHYMQKMFKSMCEHDRLAFESAANKLRANTSVDKFKADNEWFQFLDYFFDKLVGSANGVVNAYSMFQAGRLSGKRASKY